MFNNFFKITLFSIEILDSLISFPVISNLLNQDNISDKLTNGFNLFIRVKNYCYSCQKFSLNIDNNRYNYYTYVFLYYNHQNKVSSIQIF